MGEYENTLVDIRRTMGLVLDEFKAIPPDALPSEWAEMKKYVFSETKIPAKYRELIGLAVASTIHCPYCIHVHTRGAKMNGATDEEITETGFLARFTLGWSAMLNATGVDLDKLKQQFAQVEEYVATHKKH